MPQRTSLAIGSLLAITLGSAGTLLAPAASATSPYTDSYWEVGRHVNATDCTTVYDPATPPSDTPVAADGASHTFTQSYKATVTSNADPTDITTVNLSQRATGRLGAQGTDPSVISMAYSSRATASRTKTPSVCEFGGYVYTELEFDFTLTRPMWVNVSLTSPDSSSYSEVYIHQTTSGSHPYVDLYNYRLKFDATGRTYLPAGDYSGYLEGELYASPAGATTNAGALKATFTVPGSRSAGPSGKAKSYVSLASARNCATHTLATKVTTNKKRAKTIKKIVFTVNGHKVKTARSHLRGKTIPLTLSDTKAANVKATVTTVQKKHHKKIRKTRTVTASYRACS